MDLLYLESNLNVIRLQLGASLHSNTVSEVWSERVEPIVNNFTILIFYMFENRIIVYSSNVLNKTSESLFFIEDNLQRNIILNQNT